MTRAERIEQLLWAGLPGSVEIAVIDESARHAGHAGARPEGETHYRVHVVSLNFTGLSRIERARFVHRLLAEEFATGLHALSLDLHAIDEAPKPGHA